MGSLYERLTVLLDTYLIGVQVSHNKTNRFLGKLKLVLVKSADLLDIPKVRRSALVYCSFVYIPFILSKLRDILITLPVQIVLVNQYFASENTS